MEFVKIIAVGLVTAFASMLVKQFKPEIAILINVAGGILIIVMSVNALMEIVSTFTTIFSKTGLDNQFLTPLFKIIAVGYLCEFSANICADSGSSSVADKILFAGKIIILFLSLPIINGVIDIILGML